MCCGFDGAHEQRAVIVIVRNGVADGFSCADAVFIVAVDIRIRASGGCVFWGIRLQPLTFPNQSCTEVVRRVAGSVICYAFAIVRSELILPCRVCVGIGNGLSSRAERSDSVSKDLLIDINYLSCQSAKTLPVLLSTKMFATPPVILDRNVP